MEDCELCGRSTETVYIVSIEGVEFRVCPSCAKGKKIISEPNSRKPNTYDNYSKKAKGGQDENPELVDNYGKTIREARERLKIPLKVLAEMINEKETFLARVEEEKTEPPMALVKKLEKALMVNLIAKTDSPDAKTHSIGQSGRATLGDYKTE
ncbi:MAG: multiprotein bridging factor aMBF1 [Candidatus Marsarchaeota archaeon]|nr:multiprotein bridging factor aMBF1 [Candidatus Marsarchaeota archaeon]MCL5101842.1 multiprotein bridging factor aMBF1 [Candidatus Marsarchaeota archaeon]